MIIYFVNLLKIIELIRVFALTLFDNVLSGEMANTSSIVFGLCVSCSLYYLG